MVDDETIAATIMMLLEKRGAGKSICPSEAARHLSDDNWRALMDPVRRVAKDLANQDRIVVTQGGDVVNIETAKGPVRLAVADSKVAD